jgi:hypothetical protein
LDENGAEFPPTFCDKLFNLIKAMRVRERREREAGKREKPEEGREAQEPFVVWLYERDAPDDLCRSYFVSSSLTPGGLRPIDPFPPYSPTESGGRKLTATGMAGSMSMLNLAKPGMPKKQRSQD